MTVPKSPLQPEIPFDFPQPEHMGALPGAQPKLLAVMFEGKFYIPGCTPPELLERVAVCNNLIDRIMARIKEVHEGETADDSRNEILKAYLVRLNAANWTSSAEARWIIRKVAEQLRWKAPEEAAG